MADLNELFAVAVRSYDNCHAPYSKLRVGAAVLTDIGIFGGSLVESAAYPSTICAGMAAIYNAVSSGAKVMKIAAVQYDEGVPTPCGMCQQIMRNFKVKEAYSKSSSETEWKKSAQYHPEYTPFLPAKPWEVRDYSNFTFKWAPPNDKIKNMILQAIEACQFAHIPTSHFPVGAAVIEDSTDQIISGSNCETLPLGLGLCAERVTISKAITSGFKGITAIAVCCAILPDFGRPCGSCRQVMREFGDVAVYQIKLDWTTKEIDVELASIMDILPHSFGPDSLK